MRRLIAVVAVLVAASGAPAAQVVWNAEDLGGGGAEFRLVTTSEGAAIILVCQRVGVSAGFEFPTFPGARRQRLDSRVARRRTAERHDSPRQRPACSG